MTTHPAEEASKALDRILEEAGASHEPVLILDRNASGVLVAEEDRRAIQETLYLLSVPGKREAIREGMTTPPEECSPEPGW